VVKKGRSGRHWLSNGAIVMRLVLPCVWTVSSAVWSEMAWADPITFQDHVSVSADAVFRDDNGHFVKVSKSGEGSTSAGASASVMSPEGYLGSADTTFSIVTGDPLHLSAVGTGSASGTTPPSNTTGFSGGGTALLFGRAFSLRAPHTFDFHAVFLGSEAPGLSQGTQFRILLAPTREPLPGDDDLIFDAECFEDCEVTHPRVDVLFSGTLPPGPYGLDVWYDLGGGAFQAGSRHAVHGEFSLDLDLKPVVPEPASMVLLGSGVLGLLAFRKRRA